MTSNFKNKLLLLCGPSGSGKTTIARLLTITDNRFKHVEVYTTRKVRPDEKGRFEKIQVSYEELFKMKKRSELINFNLKDGIFYGIRGEAISSILDTGYNPVLEWDINNIDYWNDKFPVYRVILAPEKAELLLERIQDGRDLENIRRNGVLSETMNIKVGKYKGDLLIINLDAGIYDTVQRIRESFFNI